MSIFKRIIGFSTLIFALFGVLVIALYLVGIEPSVMLTGSMNPKIPVGSVCFINKNYSYDKIKVNDIIAYTEPGQRVVHRVIAKENGGYKTKGDNNKRADIAVITTENYYGKYVFSIPYLGYISTGLQSRQGKFLVVGFVVFIVVLNFVLNRKENYNI